MKRPTGVTVLACILLFMATGVANGLIAALSQQTLKIGALAFYAANILVQVALAIALLMMQSWSRSVCIIVCAISLVLVPRQLVSAHDQDDVVRIVGWGLFKAWAIWYLFRPHVKQAFRSLHRNSQENPHETPNPA